ncbi:MAG: ABC transporter ATP-binding protein, partial [Gemmatimonadaceae bacterium]
ENVMMPMRIAGRPDDFARGRAAELLARVGLSARMSHRPGELSGGEPVHGRNETELGELRNRTVGFVFQFHHLLREFSALENVMMPLRIAGKPDEIARGRASELLARVGLSARMTHRPGELSGGEQQRTAVARALAMDPQVILADEPSGNLDRSNAEMLHELLAEVVNDLEIGMVVVTHSRSLAARASQVLLLEGGKLGRTEVDEVVV